MSKLLINCIIFSLVTSAVAGVFLGFFDAWVWNGRPGPCPDISDIEFDMSILGDLLIIIIPIIAHFVWYQIALRKGLKDADCPAKFALLGTLFCFVASCVLPLYNIVGSLPYGWNYSSQVVVIATLVITLNYLDGLLYTLIHYRRKRDVKNQVQ